MRGPDRAWSPPVAARYERPKAGIFKGVLSCSWTRHPLRIGKRPHIERLLDARSARVMGGGGNPEEYLTLSAMMEPMRVATASSHAVVSTSIAPAKARCA
jgi:hypothetical protein